MRLKKYNAKRDFKKSPEPKGKKASSPNRKNLYIIQKHAASHLHYDFRLELNGVLLSWAVPKGPCLDPSVKRLAMHVEDHPVTYGSFEGLIPKGHYGGGTVMLWDKGKWFCEEKNPAQAYQNGKLTFRLTAEKLNGLWKLFRINKNDKTWLLVKVKDEYAVPLKEFDVTVAEPNSVVSGRSIEEIAKNARKTWGKKLDKKNSTHVISSLRPGDFPAEVSPELATLVDKPPVGDNWIHEIKFDGYRLLALKKGKSIVLATRNNNDWTEKFKTLKKEVSRLTTKNVILDGEVVVLDHAGKSDFQLLQNALKEGGGAFVYYVFDILYYDKYNVTRLPLAERKVILQDLLSKNNGKIIRYSDHIVGQGSEILQHTCELGLEGIISKNITTPYIQKRTEDWLKIKCLKRQEFIIGGIMAPREGKRELIRSLMLGTFNDKKELVYNGNVGTGFTQASIKEIYTLLKKYQTDKMPFAKKPPASKNAIWLKPVVIADVEFTEWTDKNSLRHPSFKGIRSDKAAKDVKKEKEKSVKNFTGKKIMKQPVKSSNIKLSHPDKILYPEDKITKLAIAEYYDQIQKWILPYITYRPITLVRCPDGYEKCFYQKHITSSTPDSLYGFPIKEKAGKENYIYIKDAAGLLALPQLGTLEIHPWGSKIEDVEHPDIIIFDLDPAPGVSWKTVVSAAFEIKHHLAEIKLKSFVKTTGGKGLHVVVPVKPNYDWDEIKKFSHAFVEILVAKYPKKYIAKMNKAKRTGKIFIDYLRNQRGATAVAPYSTRARIHAPVSTPLDWDELTGNIKDTSYTIKTLPLRLQEISDPWKDFLTTKQSLKLPKKP